jgi:hypothetical protein
MLYHFRVTGSNATGLTTGSDATFETPGGAAEAPTSVTGTASGIGTNTATLNGTVNPNGNDTKVTFQYGLTTSYTGTTSAQDIGSGTSAVPVTAPLTGLISGTLYHFLVTGSNAGGVTTGGDQTFTTVSTVAAPSVTTLSATNVTSSTANMNGSVNPNGADTIVTFNYGTSNTYGFTTAPQDIGSGTSAVAVTAPLVGLPAGQLYYYQVTGSNSQGAVSGSQLTFMTSGTGIAFAPIVTTNAATVTGTGTAVLHASVNPNGSPSTAYFEYGSGTNYGTTTTAVSIGSGAAPVLVSSTLTGLQPGGTYHFAAVGSSLNGIVTGSDQTFTTDFSFKAAAGKYAAVFSEDTFDTTGLATITVTAKGSFTASIKIEGKTLSFSGKFGSDGSASASHLGTTVQLQLGTTGGNNSVNIEISGLFSADAVAIELLTTKMTAASYTVRIPHPATGYPLGNGYGTLTVGKTGAIRLTGELGDGTPFTASGGMLANMTWPLYAQVYSKKGAVAGTVTFENTVNGNLDGVVNWFKPATTGAYDPLPFDPPAQVNLYGSLYAKPAKGAPVITSTNGDIVFAAGNLGTSPLDIAATLSTANKFAFPTPPTDKLTISITTSNGLFTGSFVDPTSGKKREFHGALFQGDLNFGTGVFKGTTEAGSVDIFPPL